MNLCLFDLDHTLLPIDSDYAWGEFTIRMGWCDAEQFAKQNDAFYADYQAGTLDIHEYVRFATQAFRRQGQVTADGRPDQGQLPDRRLRRHQDG